MNDRVKWARKRPMRLRDQPWFASMVEMDISALRHMYPAPGELTNITVYEPISVTACPSFRQVRPTRFVSHAPRVRQC